MTDAQKQKIANLEDLNAHSKVTFNKGIGNKGTCTTASATAAKEVTFGTTFSLVDGATALVRFTYGISAENATLTVTYTDSAGQSQTTAAKPIYYRGAALEAGIVKPKDMLMLKYNGTQWDIVGTVEKDVSDYFLIPVDVDGLTPSTTFVKGNVIGINGVIYRAKTNTSSLPITLTVENNQFVTVTINGKIAFVVSSYTLNSDWEVWTDAAIEYWTSQLDARTTALETATAALQAADATLSSRITTLEGTTGVVVVGETTYTMRQLLEAMATLMTKNIVTQP